MSSKAPVKRAPSRRASTKNSAASAKPAPGPVAESTVAEARFRRRPVPAERFRNDIAAEIVVQAESSTSLSANEKNAIARVMGGRGWFNKRRRERVIDNAVHQLHAEQLIDVTPDGVEAAIDWDGIASFLERIMPLILTLIKLFGG